jgi:putative DNA primase/helicase
MPEQDEGAPTGRKLLVSIKNNIARVKKGMAYSFADVTLPSGVRTSHVVWGGEVDVTADEVQAGGDQELKSSPKLSKAVEFLLEALSDGPVASADIDALAKKAGHSDMTMRRARQYLKVEPYQQDGKWWCDLDNGKNPEDEAAE